LAAKQHKTNANQPDWPAARGLLSYRFRKWMPSTKDSLNEAAQCVREAAEHCCCDEEKQADVEIVVREAMANAIWHGNGSRDGTRVFFRCYGGPKIGILIVVRDEGEGFDPDSVPDPRDADRMYLERGRGLFLMRALMDDVRYRHNGREVVLFQSA
jgi:serine/threonine-protein kinase RsbW